MNIYKSVGNGYFKKAFSMLSGALTIAALEYCLNSSPVYAEEKKKPAGEITIEVPSYKEQLKEITVDMDEYNKKLKVVEESVNNVKKGISGVNQKLYDTNKRLDGIVELLQNIKPGKQVVIKNGKTLNLDEKFNLLEKTIENYFNQTNQTIKGYGDAIKEHDEAIEALKKELKKGCVEEKKLYEFGLISGGAGALIGILLGYLMGRLRSSTSSPSATTEMPQTPPTETTGKTPSTAPESPATPEAVSESEKEDDEEKPF